MTESTMNESTLNQKVWPRTAKQIDGALEIGGCDLRALAREFSTPLFILDESDLDHRIIKWRGEHSEVFGKNAGQIYYAAKAFISIELAKIIAKAGLGIDVCTGGELAVVKAANFPGDRIEMHGNNKSEREIANAIDYRVGTIVLDSLHEIERVARIAKEKGVRQRVMIRLTPGVEAHTHEAIKTAHEDVKFGFSIASGAAVEAVAEISRHESSLDLVGVHAHIGSQIFATDGFETTAERLMNFLSQYRNTYNRELEELCIGGGFGIAYQDSDNPIDSKEFLVALEKSISRSAETLSLKHPRISIEPGRAIIGPTMVTLYEVGTTKEVTLEDGAHRRYISVDGGMSDNIRPSLYGAQYSITLANRNSHATEVASRVVGKHCETGDIIIHDVNLPSDIKPGDLLAVPVTGAYGRSMASNYNHVPRPAVISVRDGAARTILRRETEADLIALDVFETAKKIPAEREGGR